jgi:hypothetical protein
MGIGRLVSGKIVSGGGPKVRDDLLCNMRDEIEWLRAQNAKLRAALRRVRRAVADDKTKADIDDLARRALEQKRDT